jgi:hypothetical protein
LVFLLTFWYIFPHFGTFSPILVHFSTFWFVVLLGTNLATPDL